MASSDRVILVTGVRGQLGFELLRSLQGLGRIVAADRSVMDLSDPDSIRQVVSEFRPAVIVNPAAYTAVDKAELETATAADVNAHAPAVMAEEAKKLGALLVQFSTDYVFDGRKAGAYTEEDEPNPQNVYGRTKLEGEQAVAASGCRHLIFRTSWVYSNRGQNFLTTMLRLATERDELSIVSDQIGAPTCASTIAAMTSQVLAQALSRPEWGDEHAGLYHFAAAGETSWFGFAQAIFELANLDKARLRPITSAEYPARAVRPANSRLDTSKLRATFGTVPQDWREALTLCISQR
ncbi:dTDP-4-dehydrorhamnose reductase [Caballeronia sp. SL2Y3]|uniref:dTDP-4-dehydrorhamnose reductase n=1 Tax=Caballeronia sp. SL2Y3 TaxID=2878151 RepID=UPI001FD2987F|nr:dTDP-4-dehydrorhamnose reductase [Caballeronia sp. SL2Y3]